MTVKSDGLHMMTITPDGRYLLLGGKNLSMIPNEGKKTSPSKLEVKLSRSIFEGRLSYSRREMFAGRQNSRTPGIYQ